jgi:hypothetical protein
MKRQIAIMVTFFRLCLQLLQPARERQMLVFFGRVGAGAYILMIGHGVGISTLSTLLEEHRR